MHELSEQELIRQAMSLLGKRPRRPQEHVCSVCGTRFESPHSQRDTCSAKCRMAKSRQRRAEKAREQAGTQAGKQAGAE